MTEMRGVAVGAPRQHASRVTLVMFPGEVAGLRAGMQAIIAPSGMSNGLTQQIAGSVQDVGLVSWVHTWPKGRNASGPNFLNAMGLLTVKTNSVPAWTDAGNIDSVRIVTSDRRPISLITP